MDQIGPIFRRSLAATILLLLPMSCDCSKAWSKNHFYFKRRREVFALATRRARRCPARPEPACEIMPKSEHIDQIFFGAIPVSRRCTFCRCRLYAGFTFKRVFRLNIRHTVCADVGAQRDVSFGSRRLPSWPHSPYFDIRRHMSAQSTKERQKITELSVEIYVFR